MGRREGPQDFLRVEMFYILIGVSVTCVYTFVRTHRTAHLRFMHFTLSTSTFKTLKRKKRWMFCQHDKQNAGGTTCGEALHLAVLRLEGRGNLVD